MSGYTLTVDLSNKSAWITDATGRAVRAWSDVTRRSALSVAQLDGWVATSEWVLTSPPDGFVRSVHPLDPSTV